MSRRSNRSAGPRPHRRRKYAQCALDGAQHAAFLDEILPVGDGEVASVMGWFLTGALRRVVADYPNGWRLTLSLSAAGDCTRICASLHEAGPK